MLVIPEDWFALSHFERVLSKLACWAQDVVVVTRYSGRFAELEALGVRTRALDIPRGSLNPVALMHHRSELASHIDQERPDIVHAVSLQTMAMTSLALEKAIHRPSALLFHLTGLGYLGISRSPAVRLTLSLALAAIRRAVRRHGAWVLAENADDISFMMLRSAAAAERTGIIPGAGVDPDFYAAQAPARNSTPRVAFIGRMLRSKGVEVLVEAYRRLRRRGIKVELDLYGWSDPNTRQAISASTMAEWRTLPGLSYHGRTDDVVGVWQTADIAVVPSFGGEGMPRVMLEAASCCRPLIVTDVPGCRNFVQPGVEGLVVLPGEPEALASSIALLADSPELRKQMGEAARKKVLAQYSTNAVVASVFLAYERALASIHR